MDRVFMDGGNSLNIIFTGTLRKMLIPQSVWKKSGVTIYGIVPGEAAASNGTIELDVIFGSKGNFTRKVRSTRLAVPIPRHTRATRICAIHGGPALCIPQAQD